VRLTFVLLLGLLPAWPVLAGAPVLPDAVRPGAIRPGEERRITTPTAAPGEEHKVPRVVDRPLDVDAGPKVAVTKFNLIDVVDRPEHGITVADVQALVDGKLKERPEGFTVGRLQDVANAVTQYYRTKGLILTQAFIPVQDVQAGIVNLQVHEGVLGRVVMEGNQHYGSDVLSEPFNALIGKPVTKEATETALLRLTDYPGLGLFGVFQPGQQVGAADMVIKVQQEKRFEGNVRFDNYGLKQTGIKRWRVEGSWNNPTNSADKLTASSQVTTTPDNLLFYNIDYSRPLFGPQNKISVGYNRTVFDVSGIPNAQSLQITSVTENSHVDLERSFIRSRELNLSAQIGVERKAARTRSRSQGVSRDDLSVLVGRLNYDSVDVRFSGLNTVEIDYEHGVPDFLGSMGDQDEVNKLAKNSPTKKPSRQGSKSKNFATGDFDKVFFTASRLQSMAILGKWLNKPEFFKGQSLQLRVEGQWSDDLLVPLEQYAVGGPANVRAYQPTEVLFDKAMFFSTEYIINAPGFADKPAFSGKTWGELLQFSLFYDVAFGERKDPFRTDVASRNYNGAGFAISFNNQNVFSSKFIVAEPLGTPLPANRRFPQFWVDFNYFF
jgi:hemolysin activation/secretion protein